ncbi:hypothetical protein [Sphingomonas hylomeconis]|uniref:Uncharacterized protein n=1 Tax=Sphingomonas hylomeconis TaxID=1395958 RepID=A0ABV7SXU2_9SPHN|nr:hypothetical protein [Sphingomonas hylomeconis]
MLADQTISDLRADLLQVYDALDGRAGPFDIGLLRHELREALRDLSRAASIHPARPERAIYRTSRELLGDLLIIRIRLEDLLMTGLVPSPAIVGDLGPALFNLSRGITGLVKIISSEAAARAGVAG